MAVGIAGDVRTAAVNATNALTEIAASDLLTQILVELRTLTTVTTNLNPVPPQDLSDIRVDQELAIATGVDY